MERKPVKIPCERATKLAIKKKATGKRREREKKIKVDSPCLKNIIAA